MHYIRNFCIIAHIDHGKSTLADRLLEFTKTVSERKRNQLLDDMDLERERGITIKSHAVQMEYKYNDQVYILNLIDTPGHVDFSYEVSRSIAACEGALLVVDCTKSIQAQTISNLSLALKKNLVIIPVLNKIDLLDSISEEVMEEIMELVQCKMEDIIPVSAKNGLGIDNVLEKIVTCIPAPKGDHKAPLQALIFDSLYNPFTGIEAFFRVKNGSIRKGQKLRFMSTGKVYYAYEVGILKLKRISKNQINTGDVGYLVSGIKNTFEVKVGDTITDAQNPAVKAIEKFEEIQPMVFASIYPVDSDKYEELRSSMEKLHLNDAAFSFSSESSPALGFGFHCGFLGLLHMEVIKDRLEREYGISVILTIPNVSYKVHMKNNQIILVNNPSDFPEMEKFKKVEEPYVSVSIMTKNVYIGNIISLCIGKRGIMIENQNYFTSERIKIIFEMPLSEIVFDFYDQLKTISRGYASFDYNFIGYRDSDLRKITVLINYEKIESLSILVHKTKALFFAKKICQELAVLIPKHQFSIPIQVSVSGKIIARETIKALRKNVTEKCYGGDVSRKKKLIEKQRKGKKKMRKIGKVEIPSSAFMTFLKVKN
ncbi:translation elongation factor 4 [Blattabacterium sp. (Blattella germanica)]|uniref:translation elongation factor 4 n=1 Tax=Blattabacterium sp. (Blattella germanica) TaxID=624186 RepID=UPI0011EA6274|nr:translation elongation factor 4 [Blattabacterium sp. (Blattella germanica)]